MTGATNEKPRLRKQPGFSSYISGNSSYQIPRSPERACGDDTQVQIRLAAMMLIHSPPGICSDFYVLKCVLTPTALLLAKISGPRRSSPPTSRGIRLKSTRGSSISNSRRRKWSRQLKLPDSGAIASTLTTGSRPRSVSSSAARNSSCRTCSILLRSVVFPTPVGPKTKMIELGAGSRIAAVSLSLASTRRGWATK